ncbi:MAG: hypothetical protein OEW42_17165 [Acidimicrobiia bacterium]|nr:hypothetical protein [Acidimicrobiia bacterium]
MHSDIGHERRIDLGVIGGGRRGAPDGQLLSPGLVPLVDRRID